jgi:excisionase family DNA binding protein
MATTNPPRYYTVAQAARLLGVSPSTVWRWIEAEKLAAYRIGPRRIRIREDDLEAAIRPARTTKATTPGLEGAATRPPSAEELARRQALVATIWQKRQERRIAPLTSADLVHQAREEAGLVYDRDC